MDRQTNDLLFARWPVPALSSPDRGLEQLTLRFPLHQAPEAFERAARRSGQEELLNHDNS